MEESPPESPVGIGVGRIDVVQVERNVEPVDVGRGYEEAVGPEYREGHGAWKVRESGPEHDQDPRVVELELLLVLAPVVLPDPVAASHDYEVPW